MHSSVAAWLTVATLAGSTLSPPAAAHVRSASRPLALSHVREGAEQLQRLDIAPGNLKPAFNTNITGLYTEVLRSR